MHKTQMIQRFWTKDHHDPFYAVKFVKRQTTSPVTQEKSFVFAPSFWSQTAVDIVAQKYLKKNLGPKKITETDFRQLFIRLAKCWRQWGEREKYFYTKKEAQVFEDEVLYMLVHQIAAPNSPQWFNTGIYEAYGYRGEVQGHWYYDEKRKKCVASKSSFMRPQPHACFIQSVNDDLVNPGGIIDLWQREARLFKYGSGTGTNFSNLRAAGEPLKDGGYSSGVMSFLKVGDQNAAAIKSGGTTRRAAKMVILDDDHPDILDFIQWKEREEKKVAALVIGNSHLDYLCQIYQKKSFDQLKELVPDFEKRGLPLSFIEKFLASKKQNLSWDQLNLSADWQGEAYQTVSGQNSNNSVRLSDQFMQALEKKKNWKLIGRVDGKTHRTLRAQELMDRLAQAAWSCADPGVQFSGTINQWHTCLPDGEIRGSNPCSEYLFLDDTACNLASLNVLKFLDDQNHFLKEAFAHSVRIWTFVLEISVAMAQYPSEKIALRSYQYRTLGLGPTNLGAFVMAQGLSYDSDEARSWIAGITSYMSACAWKNSVELAQRKSPFVRFSKNKKQLLHVLQMHSLVAQESLEKKDKKNLKSELGVYLTKPYEKNIDLFESAAALWKQVCAEAKKHGVRNAQTTLIAPTGTISLIMDCQTTGIEPEYALVKWKDLAGGGRIDFKNSTVLRALEAMDIKEDKQKKVLAYLEEHHGLENCPHLSEEQKRVFDCARASEKQGQRYLSADAHLLMVAAASPFLCGAISKTINLDQSVSAREVEDLFVKAYHLKIKAVAIYRDGCKLSQPLNQQKFLHSGFMSFSCPFCSELKLIRTGTCYRCENCGESTSCG